MYSIETWRKDGDFSAQVGEEVSEEVYFQMLNVLDPIFACPRETMERAPEPIKRAFLVGEPYDHDSETGRPIYSAFGMAEGPRYYYLGLSHTEKQEARI